MRFLLGPEFFWLLLYFVATIVGKINRAPSHLMDDFIDKSWFYIPAISLLVFGLWWVPPVEKNWLLLRVWIAGLVGGHFVLEKTFSAYSNPGPGSGMGYMAALMLEFIVLVAGSIFIKIKFW